MWNFYGDCLTDHSRLLALAAKLWTSSGVKFLRWLLDGPLTTTGFCYETLHQFWCETFTMIALRTTYDYWLLLRNFAPVLVWNFYGDCLTDYLRLLAFAAKLCTSSGVKLLRWLADWLPTTSGFCCEILHQFWCETFTVIAWLTTYDYWLLVRIFAPVLVWNFYGDCLTDYLRLLAFAAKLCASSGVKLLRWLPDWLPTTTSFCCETLHQFWCETFTVIAWLTAYDYWLLLRNFAPVLVWNFYRDFLTDHSRLLAFAARLWTSSGVKLLRWLLDGTLTTNGFCCDTLNQFWCEIFTVIAWRTTYDYWVLLRNFAPVLVWNFYDDCLTDQLRLLAFVCETLHQFCCETFTVISRLTTYDYWLLPRNLAPVLVRNFYDDRFTDRLRLLASAAKLCTSSGVKLLRWLLDGLATTTGFCCETLHQIWCETFTVICWQTTYEYWLFLRNFLPVLLWNFYGDCLTD